jgi:hypothetical protein
MPYPSERLSGATRRGHTTAPEVQKPSQWPCLTKLLSEMCSQRIVSKALSQGIIGKSVPILAEITIRKSQYIGEQTKQGYVKKYIRDSVKNLSHTPDAVFALEKNNKPALFFVEIDRGTELISDPERGLLKAIIFYLNYWTVKGYARYEKDFRCQFETARVLILTTTQTRLQHIREAVTKLDFTPKYVKRFLWVTSEKEAIFSSVWHALDTSDTEVYAIE